MDLDFFIFKKFAENQTLKKIVTWGTLRNLKNTKSTDFQANPDKKDDKNLGF